MANPETTKSRTTSTSVAAAAAAAAAAAPPPPSSSAWSGTAMTQLEFMEQDTVLVLDAKDTIIGSASKKDSHVFAGGQPYGILHRAFSVFLIDASTGKMLLQQRAASKITFPNVWTNACCSHPLHGMDPSEVDLPQAVSQGTVPGIQNAAKRKLHHELGLPLSQINVDDMTFVTRLHYWAADTVTHGPNAPWGEHEIDYVLFWVVHQAEATLTIQPDRDEVQDVKWVSPTDLETMQSNPNLLFSPWFRLICRKWLIPIWWKDVSGTVAGQYSDYATIHAFDPPPEHFGGAGNATPLFLPGDETKKQGAYGKVRTHQESKLSQLSHLDEVWAALTLLYLHPLQSNLGSAYVRQTFPPDDLQLCDDILVRVSRSFAAVIRQLPEQLLVDVLVFYLVLRALDTIEDDTSAFGGSVSQRKQHLLSFAHTALQDPHWCLDGVGHGDEKRLLQNFPQVHRVYQCLSSPSQQVIADVTHRMATGMAEFVASDLGQGTKDVPQYNRYCHFVAGLVGEGLSRLFAASGLESASLASELHLSDQMGLFLQKTNIIRDYLEDFVDKRAFWPQTIWKKHSATGELGYFVNQSDSTVRAKSLACLNEMVTDALELAPDCLTYLSMLHCPEVFRFCAIPQVMAIATLEKCYNNPDVFTGVVKIRKGLSCRLILGTRTTAQVHEIFHNLAETIRRQISPQDPSASRTLRACESILEVTAPLAGAERRRRYRVAASALVVPGAALLLAGQFGTRASSAATTGGAIAAVIAAVGLVVADWNLVSRSK